MVENQHSINTILSFGAKSVNPEILEKLLIGREKTADYLFNAVKSIAEDGNNNQQLIIGQRGMGKTHLFRILFHRIQKYIIDKKLVVAYFSEEEYGVANYFDFLTRIINAILKWNDADKEVLLLKIEELQETQQKAQVNVAEKIIEDYIGKRPLLILAENFGDILESIKPTEQSKLRAWLYKVNRISIIASSQSISENFDREDRPFYGFFNLYYLKNLDFEGSLEFLISLAKLDKRDDVVKHLENKGRGQVKAIHQLVKGNHRLLVTFYEFLKTDTLAKLSSHFIKTINDLKPYYETYIRYLPAQQQKILRYVALSRKPQQGKDISKNCFIDQKSLSKQMSELSRKSLIEILEDTDDKRNKLYDILEPLLRISIEVGEHREGITSLFIDFLAIYYNENELSDRKNKFNDLLSECDSHHEKIEFNYEIQAIDKALELKKTVYKDLGNKTTQIINKIKVLFKNQDWKNAEILLNDVKHSIKLEDYYTLLGNFYYFQKDFVNAIDVYEKAEKENKINYIIFNYWGLALSELAIKKKSESLFKEGFDKFSKSTKLKPDYHIAYFNWGIALKDLFLTCRTNSNSDLIESSEKFSIAYKLNSKDNSIANNYAKSLSVIGNINKDEKLYVKSISIFNNLIKLNRKEELIYFNLGIAQTQLGEIKKDKQLFNEGFANFQKALSINKKSTHSIINFALALNEYSLIFSEKSFYLNYLVNYINENSDKLSMQKIILNIFSYDSFDIIKEFFPIMEKTIKNKDVLINCIIGSFVSIMFQKKNNLNSEKISFLKTVTENHKKDFPELLIVQKYLNVYEEYVINGNKKSLYDLPKEQRTFFKEHILGN